MDTTKSANELHKESKSTLSFKDWLEEQKKEQKTFILNKPLNDIIESAKAQFNSKPLQPSQKILGLNKNVIYISIAIVGIAIIVKSIKK